MNTETFSNPEQWAEQTFGQVQLRDRRRTRRAAKAAGAMMGDASASLPKHQHTWKDLKALYRLLDESDVTFEALMQPHYQQTHEQMETEPVVSLGQDTTEIDLSHHARTKGLGQVGNEKGRGLLLPAGVGGCAPDTSGLGLSRSKAGCAHRRSSSRAALSETTPRATGNRRVDADGRTDRLLHSCRHAGARG